MKKLQKIYQNFENVAKQSYQNFEKFAKQSYETFEKVAKISYLNFNYSCKNQYISFLGLIISKSLFLALFSNENFQKSYIKVT